MATPTPIITEGPYVRIENSGLSSYTTTLTGGTSVSGDANPVASWQWVKVSSSLGDDSSVTLVNSTTDTVTIEDIAPGEAIRVMLRLTNSSAEASVTTPYPVQSGTTPFSFATAPATAFCDIAVALPNSDLVKSPPGARDWATRSHYPLVDEVESLAGRMDAVEDQQVAPADPITPGTVTIAYTPLDRDAPKVNNHLQFSYSCYVPGALEYGAPGTDVDELSGGLCGWPMAADRYIQEVVGLLRCRGDYVGAGDYVTVLLYNMTQAQYVADDWASATQMGTLSWQGNIASRVGYWTAFTSDAVPANNVVVARVMHVPPGNPAQGLSLTVSMYQRL